MQICQQTSTGETLLKASDVDVFLRAGHEWSSVLVLCCMG